MMFLGVDLPIFKLIYSLTGKSIYFDSLAIFLAQDLIWFLIILSIFILFLFSRRQRSFHIFFIASGTFILSYIFLLIIQHLYFRPRPFVVLNFEPLIEVSSLNPSFPSFHALASFVFVLTVYEVNKKLGVLFMFFAVLISLARVIVGVHWFSDILFSALIAILSFCLIKNFLKNVSL